MSQQRYPSPRLRYLKARLLILARPGFLIAVAFLSAVGLTVKEYWTNPNFLKFSLNQESFPQELPSNSQSVLSDEDRAIAADIGNLSVLDYDKKQADIALNKSISQNAQKQNQEQINDILNTAKKNQNANEINSNINSQTVSTSSTSPQNPFLKQAENLLKFRQVANVNNLSSLVSSFKTPQDSFQLGLGSSNYINNNQNAIPESALQAAINQSNSQNQESSAVTTSNNRNLLGQLSQSSNNLSTTDNRLRPNPANPLVDTRIFNQPLNNQVPTNNYNQSGVNNQLQNSYSNLNNYQLPTPNNYNQPAVNNQLQNPYGNFNNQLPTTSYVQPVPNSSLNNNQLPTTSYVQPNLYNNNQQQNPYSNFNNNQLPTNNYNFNRQVQNPYSNSNNNQIRGNRYSPQIRARVNRIYNRLINRNNPTVVNPNNINTGFGQPNTQQLNSPYSTQNPVQYPSNGYRY